MTFVGSASPSSASRADWASFRLAVLSNVVGVKSETSWHPLKCSGQTPLFEEFNVTIVDRKVTKTSMAIRILNVDVVKSFVEDVLNDAKKTGTRLSLKLNVRVIYFETLSVAQQAEVALYTQLMIGIHGNGLTWTGLLDPRRSALIEVWSAHAFNGNYKSFANNIDFKYISLEHSTATAGKGRRRGDMYVNTFLLQEALIVAAAYFSTDVASEVKCAGVEKKFPGVSRRNGRADIVGEVETTIFREWLFGMKKEKLWVVHGIKKKHWVHGWDMAYPQNNAGLGMEGIASQSLDLLGLETSASSNFGSDLAVACTKCAKIYNPPSKLKCFVGCTVLHHLSICLGHNVTHERHIALQAAIAQHKKLDGSEKDAKARHIREMQVAFFNTSPEAKAHWNRQNTDDVYP